MNSLFARYSAAIIGFGFVAVWVSVGVSAALLCLLGSAASYLGTATAQRRRLDAFTTRFIEGSQPERRRDRTRQAA